MLKFNIDVDESHSSKTRNNEIDFNISFNNNIKLINLEPTIPYFYDVNAPECKSHAIKYSKSLDLFYKLRFMWYIKSGRSL